MPTASKKKDNVKDLDGQKPSQKQHLSMEKAHEMEIQHKELGEMMKELSSHISSKQDIEKAKDLKIEKAQNQNKNHERK